MRYVLTRVVCLLGSLQEVVAGRNTVGRVPVKITRAQVVWKWSPYFGRHSVQGSQGLDPSCFMDD